MKVPYMRFYAGDWLSDPKVRRLTWEQKGVYIDMLALMWKNGGSASLPDDPGAIAAMLGMQKRKFIKIFHVFFEKNYEIFFRDDGRIYQKRISEEWDKANEKSQKATESARTRWDKEESCERNANALPTHSERNASHIHIHSHIKDKDIKHMCDSPDSSNPYSPDFEEFWKAYPNSKNKKGAYKTYLAALKGDSRINKATPEQLLRSAKRYAEEVKGKDPQYILHASTFLGPQERWFEYDKPLKNSNGETLREDVDKNDFMIGGGPDIDYKAYERARRGYDPYTPKRSRETDSAAGVGRTERA